MVWKLQRRINQSDFYESCVNSESRNVPEIKQMIKTQDQDIRVVGAKKYYIIVLFILFKTIQVLNTTARKRKTTEKSGQR